VHQVPRVHKVRRVLQVQLVLLAATAVMFAESRTVTGEVVDVRCYEKSADNSGDAHADCALSCARRGATLGIRTAEGVYVITGDYTAELNRRLIEFVAHPVEAAGEVVERDGRRTIRVREIKLVTRNP
jgi:hypothetical protein